MKHLPIHLSHRDGAIVFGVFSLAAAGLAAGIFVVDGAGSADAPGGENARAFRPSTVSTLAASDVPAPSDGEQGGGGESAPLLGAAPDLFVEPAHAAIDKDGNIYVTDFVLRVVKRIDGDGNITVFAGNGEDAYVDGPAEKASFMGPLGIAVGPDGRLYVTDSLAHRVRIVEMDGTVSTLAGSGPTGFGNGAFADGAGTEARFDHLAGIAVDVEGFVYVADQNNHRIRRISPTGDVATFAGSNRDGEADGPPGTGELRFPAGVAVAPDSSLYVTELPGSSVRRVSSAGVITTVVPPSLLGEGRLHVPAGIAVGPEGAIWVADTGHNRIVRLTADGELAEVIGRGSAGLVDGPLADAAFSRPTSVVFGPDGALIVVDELNRAVRKVY